MAHTPGSAVSPTGSPARVSAPLLSPKRTAREAGQDPPDDEHGTCGNADERGSDQQRHPSQRQNSDEQPKERDADGPQPRVILRRVLWCGPMDTQIREVRGQSALGGMISSRCRASWPLEGPTEFGRTAIRVDV